jgi:hydrogenase/urease accessory protein HupE
LRKSITGYSGLRILVIAAALVAVLFSSPCQAHRLRPAIATITLQDGGVYDLRISLNAEILLAGISPVHADTDDSPEAQRYNALRLLPPGALESRVKAIGPDFLAGISIEFDGRRSMPVIESVEVPPVGDPDRARLTVVTLRGEYPADAQNMTWTYSAGFGASAIRVGRREAEAIQTAFLTDGATSDPFPLDRLEPKSRWRVAWDYLVLGFEHILPKGLDHILFVLGIFLLSLAWRPLLYQVTAFTVAHSITLALSLYGIVSLPVCVVEPLIALSIVYVGVENILTGSLKPWRVWVVFGFGLLHGLGFAGVLTELKLPRSEFVTALIGFNVGVEFGQLAVILMAFFAVALWFRDKPWYRRRVVIPASAAIALTGAFWTVQRLTGA